MSWQPWLLKSAADASDDIVARLDTQMSQLHLTWMHRFGWVGERVVTAKCPVVVEELDFSQNLFNHPEGHLVG
ncbi:MAG: hypothetical protein WAW17_06390, partial [Rhodococcus sp. (in: high G+C Gram-positive bacteria)]|uniref:hypothetical protein n=1 Tax=Rhodococcus sp. TaxID=1831 RepID=UPI003BAED46D